MTNKLNPVFLDHMKTTSYETGLTNFDRRDYPRYFLAVSLYLDPNLMILDRPIPNNPYTDHSTMFSLHYLGERRDLGDFWQLFESLEGKIKYAYYSAKADQFSGSVRYQGLKGETVTCTAVCDDAFWADSNYKWEDTKCLGLVTSKFLGRNGYGTRGSNF